MYWIGTKVQNLVKQSDAYQVGSLWGYSVASLSLSGLAPTGEIGPFDPTEPQIYGYFILGAGDSYVSACDTISVNSGEQIIVSGYFKSASQAHTLYAVTPHGRAGITYSTSKDISSYFYETTSAQQYFDESRTDDVQDVFGDWVRLKFSITARSTGFYAPLLFRAGNFTGTWSENVGNPQVAFTAAQVVVNPVRRIYGVPAYTPTTGTIVASDRMDGVELNAYNVSFGKRRFSGRSVSKDADLYMYKWGAAKEASLGIDAEQISDALAVNSYWSSNATVVFMNTNMPSDVLSGTITNEQTPINAVDIRGDSGPYQSLSGFIKLESF